MRIDRIDLIRYGHFFQRAIDIPQCQPDFFVIYGDNEAGKSTLLRGISALLFGVPPRTPDVHSCKGPELRIGATISNSTASFSFRRRKGTAATLLSESETQIPEDRLSPFLHGLDRARFEQFFGLDHIRLREGGEELLRGEGEIGSALFQAAGFDLRKLLDALDKETGELFSRRSKSRVIGSALEEYKQARAQMRRLSLSGAAVKEKQAELERAKASRDALNAEADLLREQLTKLHRIAGNKPDVARLQELRTALAVLEWVPALPANARRQRDQAVADLTDATAQIESLTNQIAQRTETDQSASGERRFKAHAREIEALNAGTHDYLRGSPRSAKALRRSQQGHSACRNGMADDMASAPSERCRTTAECVRAQSGNSCAHHRTCAIDSGTGAGRRVAPFGPRRARSALARISSQC